MSDKNMTVRELEVKAASVKYELDRLNRAAYGMTFDEAIRLGKTPLISDTNKEET